MKKIITLVIATVFIFAACEGPDGPAGPPGEVIVGETFEYSSVSFNANNEIFAAEFDPPIVDGDVMLVYRLESVENGTDIWEPLPVTFYNGQDNLHFRYNFTRGDVEIISSSSNYAAFGADLLSNQVFRVVILPSDLMNSVDTDNIDAVMKAANIKTVQKFQ